MLNNLSVFVVVASAIESTLNQFVTGAMKWFLDC